MHSQDDDASQPGQQRQQQPAQVGTAGTRSSTSSASSTATSISSDEDSYDDSTSGSSSDSESISTSSGGSSSPAQQTVATAEGQPRPPTERQVKTVLRPVTGSTSRGGGGTNPGPQAPSSSSSSGAAGSGGAGSYRLVQLNANLRFERPDNEYIPLPPIREAGDISTLLRRLTLDRERFPEGRHRRLDYFRSAVEMFITQVRLEYRQQYQLAQRNGKPMQRFTWRNKGELAICFACCCDMLKLLYDTLQPSRLKPTWDSFVHQLPPLLITESRVPALILTEQTYHTKYMDWQKGGTRYGGEQSSANIRFPSAQERQTKIETYLRSGAGYRIEAVSVEASTTVVPAPSSLIGTSGSPRPQPPMSSSSSPSAAKVFALPPGTRLEVKAMHSAGARTPQPSARPFIAPFPSSTGPGPVRPPQRGMPVQLNTTTPLPIRNAPATGPPTTTTNSSVGATSMTTKGAGSPHPPASVSSKQMPEEMRHLYWLSVLAHVKGGAAVAAFPDERAATMPGFIRLCEITELTVEMGILVDVMAASSESVQELFERLGGIIAFRRFAARMLKTENAAALMHLVEQMVHMKAVTWGATSQRAWRTDPQQKLTGDLGWLRAVGIIPVEKRAAWGALLLVMEQKYIFRTPRESGEPTLKRIRTDNTTPSALRAATVDNAGMESWKLPRVNTLLSVRVPFELRAPPLCSTIEQDSIDFLNAKRAYAEAAQENWRERLTAALRAQQVAGDVTIPLWYDPYQLLGIAPTF